jgi:hypothetical protein
VSGDLFPVAASTLVAAPVPENRGELGLERVGAEAKVVQESLERCQHLVQKQMVTGVDALMQPGLMDGSDSRKTETSEDGIGSTSGRISSVNGS